WSGSTQSGAARGYRRTPPEHATSSAAATAQPNPSRRPQPSKATGRSEDEAEVFHCAAVLKGLRAGGHQDLEHVVAGARRLQADAEGAPEELRIEPVQVLAEHVADRVVHGAVHPDPDRPAIGEARGEGASIAQASGQKSAQRTISAQRD